ncbi:hypothetical protein M426DRAFT_65674 [Hypoxylon sp. CI-4A]|nr:hypothetical protein M426DRAFT_65674 [Hypoxylon sp. CI-4A]
MSLPNPDTDELRSSLQRAVVDFQERCLYQSAKWAAELLNSLPNDNTIDHHSSFMKLLANHELHPDEMKLEQREFPRYCLAYSFFKCHEYRRCAAVFLPIRTSKHAIPEKTHGNPLKGFAGQPGIDGPAISEKALFLSLYALFLEGEKQEREDKGLLLSETDTDAVINKELLYVKRYLREWFKALRNRETMVSLSRQGYLEYLYGVVLSKDKEKTGALTWFRLSVRTNPWNWSAWQEMNSLIRSAQDLEKLNSNITQSDPMAVMFNIYCQQELRQVSPALVSKIKMMQTIFPESRFLETQLAMTYSHMKKFDEASSLFSSMILTDPYRLESLFHYSNHLSQLNKRERYAFISQLASTTDRYRPETCCIIAGYYVLYKRHTDAIVQYSLALRLDHTFTPAWVLLGDQYLELRNWHAAVACYHRAQQLGQRKTTVNSLSRMAKAYKGAERFGSAAYYHRQALELAPANGDLWQRYGEDLVCMGRPRETIAALARCYELRQAELDAREEGDEMLVALRSKMAGVLYQLACLYAHHKDWRTAARCFELFEEHLEDAERMERKYKFGYLGLVAIRRLYDVEWIGLLKLMGKLEEEEEREAGGAGEAAGEEDDGDEDQAEGSQAGDQAENQAED